MRWSLASCFILLVAFWLEMTSQKAVRKDKRTEKIKREVEGEYYTWVNGLKGLEE